MTAISLEYDGLLLATGSRVRRLNIPGSDLPGIHYVRNVADVDRISEAVRPGNRLVVVGAGYIGLEVAAVAATKGLKVTVLEAVDRVMARVVCPEVSQFYFDCHTRCGVDIRCGTMIDGFIGTGQVEAVSAADGERFPCDLAIVGIGIEPVVEPASRRGSDLRQRDSGGRVSHAPMTRPLSPPATAPIIPATGTAAESGSNRFRTPSTRRRSLPRACSATASRMTRCRGSGPINTT